MFISTVVDICYVFPMDFSMPKLFFAVVHVVVFLFTQAMLVPMAEDLLGWTERDTSIFYSAAGVEVSYSVHIHGCILFKWCQKRGNNS